MPIDNVSGLKNIFNSYNTDFITQLLLALNHQSAITLYNRASQDMLLLLALNHQSAITDDSDNIYSAMLLLALNHQSAITDYTTEIIQQGCYWPSITRVL